MKKTTSERDPRAFAKLRELIQDIHIAMMTTVTPDGALRSRPMMTQRVREEDSELWFFTSDESGKARDIAEEHAVNVSYADPKSDRYVSVTGSANIIHDPDKAEDLWDKKLETWFPKGLKDPRLALMRVRVESAEYWDASSGAMVNAFEAAKASSGGNRRDDSDGHGEHTKVEIRGTPASG